MEEAKENTWVHLPLGTVRGQMRTHSPLRHSITLREVLIARLQERSMLMAPLSCGLAQCQMTLECEDIAFGGLYPSCHWLRYITG